MNKEFDFLVFIARAQPLHNGHMQVIRTALERSQGLIVLLGSANSPRTLRNPFTFEERKETILKSIAEIIGTDSCSRTFILPINDFTYNDELWIKQVQETVEKEILCHLLGNTRTVFISGLNDAKIGLVGYNKDNTSYYLKLFPQWKNVDIQPEILLNSTDIRNDYLSEYFLYNIYVNLLPQVVRTFLLEFKKTIDFVNLQEEYKFVNKYKEQWKNTPYPPIFVTVDAVVIQSGHILLVRRKAAPGEGMLALPGGYIKQDEKLLDSCLRELREETKLKVPIPALKGSLVISTVFDEPNRDVRGRIITHAFLFKLDPRKEENFKLPKVRGADDALHAFWIPLSEVKEQNMFSDHYHIIRSMVSKL